MPFAATLNSIRVETYETLKFAILGLAFYRSSFFLYIQRFLYVDFKVLRLLLEVSNLLYRFLTTFSRWRF